jgi:signal recognition particle subunit SRP19
MVAKKDNKLVIWPEYFDQTLTRARGRRVPKNLATASPNVETIHKAAKSLGYKSVLERDKKYPRFWWKKEGGRVLVSSKGIAKSRIILNIAKRMKKLSSKKE